MEPLPITASNSYYLIQNYKLGENTDLENYLSIWNADTFKRTPLYWYDEETNNLYVPRGVDEFRLRELSGLPILYNRNLTGRKIVFNMNMEPRNTTQKKSIRFLTGLQEYNSLREASQLVLSLPSGGGKTYCAVAAMSIIGYATVIITHNDEIRSQWYDRLLEYSNIPNNSIILLDSSKELVTRMKTTRAIKKKISNEYVYIVTHSLLRSFMKANGRYSLNMLFYNLGIGIKIVDEAHKEFLNTIYIDTACEVCKNIYLTATFSRTDPVENMLFQRVFQRVNKLKVTDKELGVTKNVIYISELIATHPKQFELVTMYSGKRNFKKFSIYRYIEYAIEKRIIVESYKKWLDYLMKLVGGKGVILVLSPKKETCSYFKKIAEELYPGKKCCVHNSGSKVDNIEDYNVVCATSKMMGTGNDINNLMAIINMEPIGSAVNSYQLFHRLMRGNDEDRRYYIDIIDKSVPNVYGMYKRCLQTLEKSALDHIVMDTTKG